MADTIKELLFYFLGFAIIYSLTVSSPSFAYEKEIRNLSSTIAENITKSGKKTVAVVDFTNLQGNVTELGRFISEEFSIDLASAVKSFEVIDRVHLSRILAEHKLSLSGIIDPKTVKKLGQIAGVDAIVTGSITPLENSVRVSVKVIATDTARVIGAGKGDIPKTKAIGELLTKGIDGAIYEVPSSSATSAKSKTIETKVKDFIFRLNSCQRQEDGKTACPVVVVNKGVNARYLIVAASGDCDFLRNSSRLTDNFGNQYISAKVQFGATTGARCSAQHLSPDIPTNVILTFQDVSPHAQYVHLQVSILIGGEGDSYVALRNIPLSR